MDILLQFLLVFFFIFLNGFFVLSEYSLVSSRRSKIEALAAKGNSRAQLVLSAYSSLATYISATQFGITIASLALGWLGEPALAHFFSIALEPHLPVQILFISSHIIVLAIAFFLITFLQIIFGELAPKTTALQKPESLALIIIIPLMMFTTIFRPIIELLSLAARLLLKPFGISTKNVKRSVYTEEEIKIILTQSAKSGEIAQEEVDIINRVFRLGDLPVSHIMVLKREIVAFPHTITIQKMAKEITEENLHTRFPIYQNSLDNTIGYVAVTDIYLLAKELTHEVALIDTGLIRDTLYILETTRIDDALVLLKQKGVYLGMVVNTKQKVIGMISVEDIIESLVGKWRE